MLRQDVWYVTATKMCHARFQNTLRAYALQVGPIGVHAQMHITFGSSARASLRSAQSIFRNAAREVKSSSRNVRCFDVNSRWCESERETTKSEIHDLVV